MGTSASRKARIELTTSAAGMDAGLSDARRKMRGFAREQASAARAAKRDDERAAKQRKRDRDAAASEVARRPLGLVKSIASGMAAAGGFDLAGGIGGLVSDVVDTEKEMTRFQIDAQLSADKVAAFRAELMKTSQETGVSRNSLVRAAHGYQILTGDAEGAVKSSKLFADVANASGAQMEDIAATAASLKQNLGFDPAQFREGFDVLLTLGHKGSVELRDLAGEMSGLAPQFKDFGDKTPTQKLVEMGAAMQVIRKNFGDASEMATGFRSLMTAVTKKQGNLEDFGVRVFRVDPKTHQLVKRDFLDIVGDILKNPALNDKVLPKLLGRQEAVRALDAMRDHWDEISTLMHDAANSNQVMKDSQTYMNSSSGKLQLAWTHIQNAVANALTPERIDKFASAMIKAADAFATAVSAADTFLSAVGHLLGYNPTSANVNTAEQKEFLDVATAGDTGAEQAKNDKFAIEKARAVIGAKDVNEAQQMGFGDAVSTYGGGAEGLKNLQDAAQRFLVSDQEAGKTSSFDVAEARDKYLQTSREIGQTGGSVNTPVLVSALVRANALTQRDLARALVAALKEAGIGSPPPVKIGAEPVQKAVSNNVLQRTRPGGR